ncbi:MAG: hypothetical protein HKO77_05030 [Gemmatimonadetes bacterium]|nr:hypothetical protein [Gemmatimonadota bacterium]NNL30361.1 hypothetical protein [Gemmatimonadota bacterium]
MEHLSLEDLGRLVDDPPTTDEMRHLGSCEQCAKELDTLREQTQALGTLPEIMPPKGDWAAVEASLRSEGLVEDPGLFRKLGLARTPAWMKAAAAVLLFLSGTGTGAALASPGAGGLASTGLGEIATMEDAASAVRSAEESYVTAVSRYHELRAREDGEDLGVDPITRVAALEHLVMVSQAAVRQAPGDLFLNGFLASAVAERDAALRMVSTGQDNWF